MKLELKPGVSPAYFWTTIGIGAASTAAGALALTSYAWAGMAGALIALIIGFVRGNVKPPPGVQVWLALLCMLALSSCSFLTSAAGIAAVQQIAVPLASIGLQAAVDHGKLKQGDAVTLQRGLAVVTNPNDSTTVKVFNLAELGLQTAVDKGVIKPGDSVLIQDAAAVIQRAVTAPQTAPAAKQPVPVQVQPATAAMRLSTPACLLSAKTIRHAVDDAQGDPVMPPPLPAMKQSGMSIPLFGERVAFVLSAGSVRN